jgi:hypothetical protein
MAEKDSGDKNFNKKFLQALESDNVAKRLSDIIKLALADRNDEIDRKMEEISQSVLLLRNEITAKDAVIAQLRTTCQQLEGANKDLRKQLGQQENERRRDNLIFSGIAVTAADLAGDENSSTNLVQRVVQICNDHLDCKVNPIDISSAYVVPVKRSSPAGGNRLVAVRFTRRLVRDDVYAARARLAAHNKRTPAPSRIFINEDLSLESRKLAAELRKLVKNKQLLGTWSRNSKMYVKKLDNSVITVSSLSDL